MSRMDPATPARAFRIEMGQGWRDNLAAAVGRLQGRIYSKGYGDDSSTTWVVCVVFPNERTVRAVQNDLRGDLDFGGWMKVTID